MTIQVAEIFQSGWFWVSFLYLVLCWGVAFLVLRKRVTLARAALLVIQLGGLFLILKISPLAIASWIVLSGFTFFIVRTNFLARFKVTVVWGLWIALLIVLRANLDFWTIPFLAHFPRFCAAIPYCAIGHSYMALRNISFAVDARSGKIREASLVGFFAYIFFLPSFVAGPIDRYESFVQQVPSPVSSANILYAVARILAGCVKKILFLNILTPWITVDLAAANVPGWVLLRSLYCYAWYLYIDFSAYSDFAIATGHLFGVRLPENFNWPYARRNIIEFWKHWHMSLTYWLRDYLFFPVGQRLFRTRLASSPTLIALASYLATMLFCGFWHGLALHFLIWGLYHGVGLFACQRWQTFLKRRKTPVFNYWATSRVGACLSTVLTFHFVTAGWLLFKYDLGTIWRIFHMARF